MKISIIIATMNAARFLGRCLNSILAQTFRDYEIIVQDGGSDDGTLEILETYSRRLEWRSGLDNGIYDAWNKALERATGGWAVFLGADDFFLSPDVLVRSRECLERVSPCVDFVYGNLALGRDGYPSMRIANSLVETYSKFFKGVGLPFPATFVRMNTLKENGFNAAYKIAGDYEFTIRCLKRGGIARLPHYVTFMEHGGISDDPQHSGPGFAEVTRVMREAVVPKAALIAQCCFDHLDAQTDFRVTA